MRPDEALEMLMLICFSTGWYWSIGSMVVTGRPYGKSSVFVLCTICGYILGLTAQLWDWQTTREISYLLLVYCWNLSIASMDLMLLLYLGRRRRLGSRECHFIRPDIPANHQDPGHLIHSGPMLHMRHSTAAMRFERL